MARNSSNVFVNVPFDGAYEPLVEALMFTVMACGYRVRCALEEDDSGDIRMDKLARLMRESSLSIHDLSRTNVAQGDLPRFNMPFELGLAIGAKLFGGSAQRKNRIKIMVAEPYRLPVCLSDLGGNDPSAHHEDPKKVIGIVQRFLHTSPDGAVLQGPSRLLNDYNDFKAKLPEIARGLRHKPEEVRAFANYRMHVRCLYEYLKVADARAAR